VYVWVRTLNHIELFQSRRTENSDEARPRPSDLVTEELPAFLLMSVRARIRTSALIPRHKPQEHVRKKALFRH